MVERNAVEISAQLLRVGDLARAKLLECRDRGVLENVGCHLRIAHPAQNQRAKSRIVTIDCRKLGDGVGYRFGGGGLWSEHRHGCCVVINTDHERSISRNRGTPQPRMLRPVSCCLLAMAVFAGWATPGLSADVSCSRALAGHEVADRTLPVQGMDPASARFQVLPHHAYLVEVGERDKDAFVELLDPLKQVVARADHPERRTGTRRIMVTPAAAAIVVRVAGKELGGLPGTADVRLFDLAALPQYPDCLSALNALARADSDYATAEDIPGGPPTASAMNTRELFLRAAAEYATAGEALRSGADRQLQGEAALALAGVRYTDLQDWEGAAKSAKEAAGLLESNDRYRSARAEGLLAASWIEILRAPPAGSSAGARTQDPAELLKRARQVLERLRRFHQRRGEAYDVALQLLNIAITYTYEGRFRECLGPAAEARSGFAALHEKVHSAQGLQDESVCRWGLGQLPEALRGFERALKDIGPEPYPTIYVVLIYNTALLHFALGHFDESLRLYDRALDFTRKIHSPRNEAYCLYGIGVIYYALGDRERALRNLEDSLTIRTLKLDPRGRMASLRALASLYADRGEMAKALADDREALSLAVAPAAKARLEIQQAAHTASSGQDHLKEAKAQLDEVISRSVDGDPTIQAEALLQRAIILRQMGLSQQALSDLAAARPKLHAFGNVTKEFEADFELARTLRGIGQLDAALQAVDRALDYADAVRLQTANPELRAQLQSPLRPAYDLKLELLRTQYERALTAGRNEEATVLAGAAFASADASRARTFADVAAQKYPPALRHLLAGEFERREALYRELAGRRYALESRLDKPGSTDDLGVQRLIADVSELERKVDTVNTAIAARAGAAAAHAGHARTDVPSPPAGTALISYWLGAESAYAWAVLPQEIHWLRLAAPATIAEQAKEFHRVLIYTSDDSLIKRRFQDSRALYEVIVKPLEPWLSHVTRWVFVPDGALDYIPFAALRASDEARSFVVMQHDIALTPAAWTLDATRTQEASPAARSLLMVADPVYEANDARRGKQKPRAPASPAADTPADPTRRPFKRLPFTGVEARQISALFSPAEVDQLTGLDATREQALSRDWSTFRFIHLATHGVVDAQVPQLSALILGYYDTQGPVADPNVRSADISLRTLSADVVVLSACETALGKEVRSEGLVGLGSTMLARGARAVVGSLWPVADESGAQLMTDFYWHLLHGSPRPERALALAMRSFVSRDRLADPALWAAFQVSVATLGPTLPSRQGRSDSSATPTSRAPNSVSARG
jgi:CHAT domain-containing protein/tetratricopeptide (TPR) repeat protein